MSRISAGDTLMNCLLNMAEGNPGAIRVMKELLDGAVEIDPDSALGELTHILNLDSCEVYGPHIWMLYKDVCNFSIEKTVASLRAVQLGLKTRADLHLAINNRGQDWDCDMVWAQVCERLPRFKKPVVSESK